MRKTLKTFALVALLAASAGAAPETISQTTGRHTLDHRETGTRKHDMRVPAGSKGVRLRLKATLREGELRLVVRDVDGRVRQDVLLGPAKSKPNNYDVETDQMKSRAGVWTVEVEFKNAVGSYEYTLTADMGD